jgi:hypothetical protein
VNITFLNHRLSFYHQPLQVHLMFPDCMTLSYNLLSSLTPLCQIAAANALRSGNFINLLLPVLEEASKNNAI